jgi:hypothetical protein
VGSNFETRSVKSRFVSATTLAVSFFDHVIRHSESYSEKWEYVRQNPVRAGLATNADDWRWQGEIVRLEARSV